MIYHRALKTAYQMARCSITVMAMTMVIIAGIDSVSPSTSLASALSLPTTAAAQSTNKHHENHLWPHEKSDLMPDPAITFGRLESGFRYVLMENQRPQDRVSVHLYINAGSLNETNTQQGLAHFLEHMLFNGSTHFPPGELIRYFQSIGMQFGNDANAHTGFDETVYDIILPAGDEKNLEKGLLVMRDYAMGALLLEEEVKRESGVILAEMRSRDSAAYRTFKSTLKFELPNMLVADRLPIGKAEVIKNANRGQLKDFYDTWYRPENMVLVMVGAFSSPLAKRLIEAQFSDVVPRTSAAPALPTLGTIDHDGLKTFHHYEPEAGGVTVSVEVIRAHDNGPDSLALRHRRMVEEMADQIVQNRLDARLKTSGAPFTSAAVGSGIFLNRIRYAEISADSAADNWSQTLGVLEQTLRQARHYGFTEAELLRVKKETIKRLENAVKQAPTRNSTTLARTIIRNLSDGRVIQSPAQEKADLAPLVEAVTLDDAHRAFLGNWPDDHRLVVVTGNIDLKQLSTSPPTTLIRDSFLAAANTAVSRPDAETVAAFPYLPEPQPVGSIASREILEDLGIIRVRFDNGIRLNLKQTDFKTNEVLANLIFGHGKSGEPIDLPGLSLLTEATINESGLGAMNTDQLERALAGNSTSTNFGIAETHFNFSARSVSDEVELLFQLFHAHLMDPGFRDDALLLARERIQQDYQAYQRSIEGMLKIKGLSFLAGGDSRFGMPPLEKINAIGLDDIRDWIGPQLKNAPLELSVVGDIDPEAVIALARRYLGSLPDRRGAKKIHRNDVPHLPTGTINRIGVETQIPKAMVVAAWQTDDFWDINRTRRLSVLADVFSERLRQRVREKLGAAYSPYAFNRASRAYSGYGVFQAYVNVAPDQTHRVLTEVKAIAENLTENGVTADELKRAVDPILTSIKEFRQTNGYWLNSVMTGSDRAPQQFEWAKSFLNDYGSVTKEELNALAATYLTEERSAAVVIEPQPVEKAKLKISYGRRVE